MIKGDVGAMKSWADLLEAIGTTHEFPGDVLIQILLRLPVISILRFKSVCQAWDALFKHPTFIQHHTHMARSEIPPSFLVHSQSSKDKGGLFSLLLIPSTGEPISLNPPFQGDWESIKVVGSTNGLVCLSLQPNLTNVVLWNPATREFSLVPDPKLPVYEGVYECVSSGFVYDEKMACYKVIRILHFENNGQIVSPFKVEVYSTKTKAWTRIELDDFPLLIDHKSCGTAVYGCSYWFANELDEYCRFISGQVLMWFDASNHAFGYCHLPEAGSGYGSWHVKTGLGVKGDCPVAFCYSRPNGTKNMLALTHKILKVKRCDGDQDNDPIHAKRLTLNSSGLARVVGFWRNDKIIALDLDGQLCVYDPKSGYFKHLPVWSDSQGLLEVYDYTENLASPPVH